jgi:hypothetical protein
MLTQRRSSLARRGSCLLVAGVFGAGVVATCARAHAAEDNCATWLSRDPLLDGAWAVASDQACAELDTSTDRDPQARLEIRRGPPVIVRVVMSDGRAAEREVRHPEDLTRVLSALVLLPRLPGVAASTTEPVPTPAEPIASTASVTASDPPATAQDPTVPAPSPASKPTAAKPTPSDESTDVPVIVSTTTVAPDLGAEFVTRLFGGGGGYASAGARIFAGINLDAWLLHGAGRIDPGVFPLDRAPRGFEMMSFGGGLSGARRLTLSDLAHLDLGLGVDVINDRQDIDLGRRGDGDRGETQARGEHSSSVDVRPEAHVRFNLRSSLGIAFVASAAVEVSPARVAEDISSVHPLPTWGASLGVGIGWLP